MFISFIFIFISFRKKNLSTNWPKVTAQPDRAARHKTDKSERERKVGVSVSLNLMGKAYRKRYYNHSGQYLMRLLRIILLSDFNWFFARINTYDAHTLIFPSQVFVSTIHGFQAVERTSSLTHSQYTQYTLRCDRVYIIKLKYDVHMKIQQQQQQINIEMVVKTINQTKKKYKNRAAHCMRVCVRFVIVVVLLYYTVQCTYTFCSSSACYTEKIQTNFSSAVFFFSVPLFEKKANQTAAAVAVFNI